MRTDIIKRTDGLITTDSQSVNKDSNSVNNSKFYLQKLCV